MRYPYIILLTIALVLTENKIYCQGLSALADSNGLHLSTGVDHYETYDPVFQNTLIREFNTWTTFWESSWSQIHPERYRYNFAEIDNLVRMAEKYHKPIIWGGFFLWFADYPSWLASENPSGSINQVTQFNRSELLSILDDHIEKVMSRYKGKFYAWYIANETLESPYFSAPPWTFDNYTTEMRHSFWYDSIGPDYIAHAFIKAHQVDSTAKLYINEGLWWGDCPPLAKARCDSFYNMVVRLLNQGVPIHGVGLQYYTRDSVPYPWIFGYDWNQRKDELKRFTDLGIDVQISEVGTITKSPYTHEKRQHQAELMQKTLELYLQNKKVSGMTIFSLSDKALFIPSDESWFLYNRNIEPLPAYYALKHRLQGDTSIYLHNFDDPLVNPPAVYVPDMDWGVSRVKPLVSSRYKILSANYNGTGSWDIKDGNNLLATFQSGNRFWINISQFPTDKAYWNDSDYFHISITGQGFDNGPYKGDYSFYDKKHFIKGIAYPGTPEWIRKIIPEGSRLHWEDWISNFQDHSEYAYKDSVPGFTNTDTTIGVQVKNKKMSLSMEWKKNSGVLRYYHYKGSDSAGELPLDIEFVLDSFTISGTQQMINPGKYYLLNFPNPFNSSTTIEYNVPDAANISLKIYNIFGSEISILTEAHKKPGKYKVVWNASNMASGIYFCRFQSGSYTESKKLILLR